MYTNTAKLKQTETRCRRPTDCRGQRLEGLGLSYFLACVECGLQQLYKDLLGQTSQYLATCLNLATQLTFSPALLQSLKLDWFHIGNIQTGKSNLEIVCCFANKDGKLQGIYKTIGIDFQQYVNMSERQLLLSVFSCRPYFAKTKVLWP